MKYANTTFSMSVAMNKNSAPVAVSITLTESDVPESLAMSELISGQSPRVRFQNRLRADGVNVAREYKMSWIDWLTPKRGSRQVTPQVMTPEAMVEHAKGNKDYMAMLQKLLAESLQRQAEDEQQDEDEDEGEE
jgi:hypothetical protein